MTPTPYAASVGPRAHELVRAASAILTPEPELDLSSLDRTFTVQSHDLLLGMVAARLLGTVVTTAPGVRLRFVAEASVDTAELRQGKVDLQLGGTVSTSPEISSEIVGTDHLGVVVRPGHPLLDSRLTAARFASAQHVLVSRRGRLHDPLDQSLAEMGLSRRVVATVPTSVDALRIVAQSDVITTVPIDAGRALIEAFGLETRELPVPSSTPTSAVSSWHQRYDSDPAHVWLRSQVKAVFAESRPGQGWRKDADRGTAGR